MAYLQRSIEDVLQRAVGQFPAVVLIGPRQSGKTTTLARVFGKSHNYVSLDDPDVARAAHSDPRGFLDIHPAPLVIDEVQRAPDLIGYVKHRIDAHRQLTGQFILSGSQNLLLMQQVTETLAGRAAVFDLLPLSLREIAKQPTRPPIWEGTLADIGDSALEAVSAKALWQRLVVGCYPEPATHPSMDPRLWHASYVRTYLERDVRSIRNVADLGLFGAFLKALAASNGQLLNMQSLSSQLGVSLNTVKAWLSVLEACFQVVLLRPYFANLGKRPVKTPKVYFLDTGTLCYLLGLSDVERLRRDRLSGSVFEAVVLAELLKLGHQTGMRPSVYFWRTAAGAEVDFLVETASGLVPIEAKASQTAKPSMGKSIRALRSDGGDAVLPGYVVYAGSEPVPLGGGTVAVPLHSL
jgi:predicted AAA+ superfamily ATPase